MSKLSIDFIPMEILAKSPLDERVELILDKIKNKKIVVLNSRFDPRDEAVLIKRTMESVNRTFTGVEICSLSSSELMGDNSWLARMKETMVNFMTGGKSGITVIGPAKIVREIKREPDRISLFIK
ncbi:MAG TPA: DUF2073 domain-containing protein [Candidatus Nanoarchaeia archaeon]|nr:DUF2073 domain-containing protein [Candidatus Nanoarchaeia archaeon]